MPSLTFAKTTYNTINCGDIDENKLIQQYAENGWTIVSKNDRFIVGYCAMCGDFVFTDDNYYEDFQTSEYYCGRCIEG